MAQVRLIRIAWRIVMLCAAGLAAGPAQSAQQKSPPSVQPFAGDLDGPHLLNTVPLRIRADRFEESRRRALADASALPALQRLLAPARRLSPIQQLAYLQAEVPKRIRWISDATEWGQHDYWASAAETLARGAGDMEDRAIVKMQALKGLGFSSNDLYLTMGRDSIGGPLTVLVVRLGGQFLVLDDTGGRPYPIDQRRKEFKPLLTFGWNGIWLHRPAEVRQASAPRQGLLQANR